MTSLQRLADAEQKIEKLLSQLPESLRYIHKQLIELIVQNEVSEIKKKVSHQQKELVELS